MPDQTADLVSQRPFRGRLFGSFALAGPGGTDLTPHGRKTRALIAFLLLADPLPMPRERLSSLLWGDRGEDQARASLRQALLELRGLTRGERPLLQVDRTQIRLLPDALETDLDRMRALAAGSDAAGFAAWLGERPAELLADLDGVDAGFDQWLVGERARRQEERHAAALAVGDRAFEAGDGGSAYLLAVRLLTAEPFDERAVRLAMEACHLRDDRNGIHRVFTHYRDVLRKELDLAPSDEVAAAYRRLMTTSIPRGAAPKPVSAIAPPAKTGTRAPRRRWLVGAITIAGLVVAATGVALSHLPGARNEQRLLLVTPLKTPAGDSGAEVLREGLSAELAQMIVGNDTRLSVVDPQDDVSTAQNRADYFIAGEAQTRGEVLHASVRLLDRKDDAILWANSFSRSVGEVEDLRQQIASKIADVTVCALGGHNPTIEELGLETMRLYLAACEQKHGDWSLSAKLLTQVVQQRPNFAHGWAMLAAATTGSADQLPPDAQGPLLARADEYARHALSLDPSDGEAYPPHAYAMPRLDQWPERMAVLLAGHDVDPGNSVLNWCIAEELAAVGRWHEGIVFAKRAFELDPFSPYVAAALGRYLAYTGADEELRSLLATADKRWPRQAGIAELRFRIASSIGDPGDADAVLADPHRPIFIPADRIPIWQALIRARQQHTPVAIEAAAALFSADALHAEPESMMEDVQNLVILGRIDDAYAVAARVEGPLTASRVLFYGYMAPFRADPRFMGFVARHGLLAIWRTTKQWPDFCSEPSLGYDCRRMSEAGSF